MALCSPFSGSTDLGKLIKASTVKMMMGASVWTGFVIGSKYNRSLILTIAHEFLRMGEWLTQAEIQANVRVEFFEDPVGYRCRVVRYLRLSDMLLVVVDGKSTDNKLAFPPRLENKELLSESELLGSRGHPKNGRVWSFVEGSVASPRLVNQEPRVMGSYETNMVYFEHRAYMPVGYSGAPMVNFGGFAVGMHTGSASVAPCYAMGVDPFLRAAKTEMDKTVREHGMNIAVRERERLLDDISISYADLRYSRRDTVTIKVPQSDIGYAIHADYLEGMLRNGHPHYEQNLSLEDIYLAPANVHVPANMQLA